MFRFAIWLFFSFLRFSIGRIHSIHTFIHFGVQVGIYGVLPLKSQKDLGEGLVRGAVIPVFFFF